MRFVLKILGGAIVLGLILAAIALVPPHLQVRSVEPALPGVVDLRALLSVENGPVRTRYVNTSSQVLPQGELAHTVFLVEWANGDLFMIDAGMDRRAAITSGYFRVISRIRRLICRAIPGRGFFTAISSCRKTPHAMMFFGRGSGHSTRKRT